METQPQGGTSRKLGDSEEGKNNNMTPSHHHMYTHVSISIYDVVAEFK